MDIDRIVRNSRGLWKSFRVDDGEDFRIKDMNPGDTLALSAKDKPDAVDALQVGVEALADLQEKLYAQGRYAVLLIFQAMDAAGKDSAIKHVLSGVNPQGCQVYSFKAPSNEELEHDFMWRCLKRLPERGRIGIFNRSYYEETLVARVHPEILDKQKLPASLVKKNMWKERFEDIRNVERYLTRNGTVILKFFLNVSKKEQLKRFQKRLDTPEKNWKFSAADLHERTYWAKYMRAYEDMIRNTATSYAPWYVVPADHKWFTRIVVAAAIISALHALDLHFPEVTPEQRKELEAARKALS